MLSMDLVDSRFFEYNDQNMVVRAVNGNVISLLLDIFHDLGNEAAREHFQKECKSLAEGRTTLYWPRLWNRSGIDSSLPHEPPRYKHHYNR